MCSSSCITGRDHQGFQSSLIETKSMAVYYKKFRDGRILGQGITGMSFFVYGLSGLWQL